MFAVELVDPATGPSAALPPGSWRRRKKRGLLIGKGGLYGNALRMAPPLTLTGTRPREGLGILDRRAAKPINARGQPMAQ